MTLTVTHKETNKTKQIKIVIMMKMESIVQGFRDTDLTDGEYIVCIQDEIYKIELINYYDDMKYSLDEGETSKTVELGDDTDEYKTLVVKYHKDLTVDKGVTLTAKRNNELTYKKGMYICVLGDIYNEGEISMSKRGTYNQEGQNVYLWKNIDDSYEYVPANGAVGASRITTKSTGNYWSAIAGYKGEEGKNRATGGGGSGGCANWNSTRN